MFKINDVLVYGTQGVCKIVDIEEKRISGVTKKYYVLKPTDEKAPTIFAPIDNEYVLKKMRKLLTKKEIDGLIDSMPDKDPTWISNENERKEQYKNIIASGDHLELIKLIKALYAHKKAREADGKRLHMSDERFFKEAEQILYDEFQYVLKLRNKDELMIYILKRIEKKVP